ncbi:murein transglycosylase A [Leptolyngbya ohadii]|uniref:murein transglycosylase A n=1 Tax=Leptolyngbya ohadii TaxID=1962290 RepID=UPI000B59E9CE|nr:murein transglycosylase A [Leptolyngbya ohadii]
MSRLPPEPAGTTHLPCQYAALPSPPHSPLPLHPIESSVLTGETGIDRQLWGNGTPADRRALLQAIDHSLTYLATPEAESAYANYSIPQFTRDRVRRSLIRFRQLVRNTQSPEELQAAVRREFDLYQSIGSDGQGTVKFTGYFEPVYAASRVQTAEFRYPLYALPPDLAEWTRPHPTRRELEGNDGLQGSRGRLRGLELVWLRDRLEAFLVQIQGSAQLQLTDGTRMSVGYAGRTDYPYVSMGRELINAGKIQPENLSLPVVIQYFRDHPNELNEYLPRNDRFIFFKETTGTPATGSLRVPVTADRSIATDKSLMPPGALALIHTEIPLANAQRQIVPQVVSRYVLDQDTGGAILGAGRVDIFMGTGQLAGDRAGRMLAPGQLYYLLLKE